MVKLYILIDKLSTQDVENLSISSNTKPQRT